MRTFAILSLSVLAIALLSGCAGSDPGGAPSPTSAATTSAAVAKKSVDIMTSGEVTKDRTLKVSIVQDGTEVKSGSFTVTPAQKNVKQHLFTQSVAAQDVQVRVFDGSNPVSTEKVQPQTCPGKTTVDVHAVDDAVHVTWKCG